jgi:alpha-L-fucosidase
LYLVVEFLVADWVKKQVEKVEEGRGFEPLKTFTLVVFKTTAIDHSAIPPYGCFSVGLDFTFEFLIGYGLEWEVMLSFVMGMMMIQGDLQGFGAVPSARQLAWHEQEYYAFVHFGPNTFTNKEWGDGLEDPKVFAPSSLDTDQWCRVFKDAGMSTVILTAKHHDGFCLWPSKFSTHTVARSGFEGDVLALLSKSCRKFGLKLGVYLSPWDRNHPKYGTPEYNDVFVNMLEDVLGNYGEVSEVWFDGANGEGPNGKKQVYDFERFNSTVRRLQPGAVIFSDAGPDVRWVGNEAGYAGETNWATINRARYVPGTPYFEELTVGTQGGSDWVPSECDVSIRRGWFWRASEDVTVKSTKELMDIWMGSVGRGSSLLLNVPPDNRGKISDVDIRALNDFKAARETLFGIERKGSYSASSVRKGFEVGSEKWAPVDGDQVRKMTLDFGDFEELSVIDFAEVIALGQRVTGWKITVLGQDGWYDVAEGTTIGRRRVVRIGDVTARKVVLEITGSLAVPIIGKFRAYQSLE